MHPRLLVLDEPTSALDPTAAEDVLATLTRLVHDLGVSVLLAEHRLERVVPFADRLVPARPADGGLRVGRRRPSCWPTRPVAPPLVELGRAAGWQPLPLTVRDARRLANGLRDRLGPPPADPTGAGRRAPGGLEARGVTVTHGATRRRARRLDLDAAARHRHRADGPQRLRQVLAAVGPAGQRHAPGRHGDRRRHRPRRARRGGSPCAGRPGAAERRRPALPGDRRRRVRGRRGRPRAASSRAAGAGHRPGDPPARPLRGTAAGPGAHAWCWPARRPCCCSTSRRAASTTPSSTPWPRPCAMARRRRPGGARGHPRRRVRGPGRRPTSSCSPRARSSRPGRYARVVAESPAFAPQVTKVLGAALAARRRGGGRACERRVDRAGGRRPAHPSLGRGARRRVAGRADDAVLAAARPAARGGAAQPAVPVPGAAAAGHRGRARRDLRGRPRPAGAGDPRRAQRLQRGAARPLGRHRRAWSWCSSC